MKYNVQYLENLQDFASSFSTNELLRRCFAKTKVIRYTDFFEYVEQLLFGTISYISFISSQKEDSRPVNNFMYKINGAKFREVVKCI